MIAEEPGLVFGAEVGPHHAGVCGIRSDTRALKRRANSLVNRMLASFDWLYARCPEYCERPAGRRSRSGPRPALRRRQSRPVLARSP